MTTDRLFVCEESEDKARATFRSTERFGETQKLEAWQLPNDEQHPPLRLHGDLPYANTRDTRRPHNISML